MGLKKYKVPIGKKCPRKLRKDFKDFVIVAEDKEQAQNIAREKASLESATLCLNYSKTRLARGKELKSRNLIKLKRV